MNQLTTEGIILQRTDYGEADRILVMLTPDSGKVHLLAKGVRKVKSKLAGGIELFSVSHVTYIKSRKEHGLGTLVSTRLVKHYGNIVKDINRTMFGYELIKQLNKATEDQPEAGYFDILQSAFEALDDPTIDLKLINLWFIAQLLRIAGHSPNLQTDTAGQKLDATATYNFSFDDMAFAPGNHARFSANHIKFMRLGFGGYPPKVLQQVHGSDALREATEPLVNTMMQTYIQR